MESLVVTGIGIALVLYVVTSLSITLFETIGLLVVIYLLVNYSGILLSNRNYYAEGFISAAQQGLVYGDIDSSINRGSGTFINDGDSIHFSLSPNNLSQQLGLSLDQTHVLMAPQVANPVRHLRLKKRDSSGPITSNDPVQLHFDHDSKLHFNNGILGFDRSTLVDDFYLVNPKGGDLLSGDAVLLRNRQGFVKLNDLGFLIAGQPQSEATPLYIFASQECNSNWKQNNSEIRSSGSEAMTKCQTQSHQMMAQRAHLLFQRV